MLAALYTLSAAELWPIPEAAGSPQQKAAVDEYMKFFGHLGGGGANSSATRTGVRRFGARSSRSRSRGRSRSRRARSSRGA